MKIFFSLILVVNFLFSFAQTIPSTRVVDWANTGYPGSIPSPTLIKDVTQFGAVGDGITDDAHAIHIAIDSLHGRRGVIYFPPGNYLLGNFIAIPDSVILRGYSSDSTKITFNFGGLVANGFNISGSASATFTSVLSGYERGRSAIVVDDTANYVVGGYAEILENNGAWDTDPVFWADNSVGQILHLTQISGDTLFFDSPLRITYDSALNVRVRKVMPAVEVGIECMEITRADNVAAGVCYNINFNYAANCWIRGVESNISVGSHVEIDASTNISIRGSYFHHSYLYDGVSTHGYGITLFAHTGQCRIENNIMQHLRHSFSLQTGANGNVIAYNYSIDPNRSEFPSNYGADISMHGHFPYANLFEGNIVQNLQLDLTHGPNGPLNTFFRNRAELFGIFMTAGALNDTSNFVGNEVTNMSPPYGQYLLFGNGNFEFGNNVKGTITPPNTTPLPDTSYYLSTYPTFWTNFTYPSIGIPNAIGTGSIPAKDRFLSGSGFTSCDDDITIAVNEIVETGISIYPNPASNLITICTKNIFQEITVTIKQLNGTNMLTKLIPASNSNDEINIPQNFPNGVYIIEFVWRENRISKKIIILK